MKGLLITSVDQDSIASELGLEGGDLLLSINNHEVNDLLDYRFFSSDPELLLLVLKKDGEDWEIEVEKDEGEELGLNFPPLKPRACKNNCIFCFAHQLPKGLRKTLYFKDEDFRFSFLSGNYVTMANITDRELERIKEERLSPLYISVHSTNPELRRMLLGNPKVRDIIPVIEYLTDAKIEIHCQVVLCPEINDGEELKRTMKDLAGFYPRVASLAIVPVGLSRYREGLYPIRPVTRDYARRLIEEMKPVQERFIKEHGDPFVFLSDEFYIKGDVDFPPYEFYREFPQIENGVGMIPSFLYELEAIDGKLPKKAKKAVNGTVITGELPSRFVKRLVDRVNEINGINLRLEVVRNEFLGISITTTGLLTGGDIVKQLKGKELGKILYIPNAMLKLEEDIFLDDVTLKDIGNALDVKVKKFDATPGGFVDVLGLNL
jgi:putative radical SAM enzyme (TIGR03279 family)